MEYVALLSRWLHVLPAIALVGGTIFMRFAFVSANGSQSDEATEAFCNQVRKRWSMVVKVSIALLLISGLYNSFLKATTFKLDIVYNALLLVKIILALAIFFFASVLTGKSDSAKKFQGNEAKWLTVNVLLSVVLVCIAGFLKSGEYDKKVEDTSQSSATLTIELG